jgi:type I restriction enzyme S subunit
MSDEVFPESTAELDLPEIPSGWKYCALEELLESNTLSYGIVQPGSEDPCGVPILRVKNIRRGQVLLDDVLRIDPAVENIYQRTRLSGGEVLVSLVGSVGETAIAPSALSGFNVARAIGVIRPSGDVSSAWLRYCLSVDPAQHYMHVWKTTTVQETLNLRDVRRLPIAMPPEYEREAITSVLLALDDKIAANDRIASTCDQLRSLRFGDWLKSNQRLAEELPLSSAAEFINGRAFTKDAAGTGRMVIRIAEINSGPGTSTIYNDIDVPDVHLAHPGDVLFAWSGSLTVARWFRPEAIINQHIFKVIPRGEMPTWLVFELVHQKLDGFKSIAAGKATTMGHIQRHHLDEHVFVPDRSCLATLDAELGPLWQRALTAEQETLALSELRDTLLPKLMSGEIRVREAEKLAEEVM